MPYAAKATIRHEYHDEQLDIFIEFFHPMEMYIRPLGDLPYTPQKPSNDLWIVEIDSAIAEITTSEWLDQYTMLLTITDVATQPARVTVQYDGPSSLLTTAWEKQWEPWAAIVSLEGWPQNFKAGMIILWHGSIASIPTGWHLCDGTSGTPDLRNRFIVCADADITGIAKTTISGTPEISAGQLSHDHSITAEISGQLEAGLGMDVHAGHGEFTETVIINLDITTNETEVLPPFYTLAYIMKL